MTSEKPDIDYDVILVGAGISGINFAYRLQTQNPELTFVILDGRHEIGGTWSLFKYPGIRSDSDLYTFGFPWRPWNEQRAIAQGPSIIKYVKESAALYGIDKKILFKHKVSSANWSSQQQTWSLSVDNDGQNRIFRSHFMLLCTGYYDYDHVLPTLIPGIEDFKGQVVHPQFWPQDLDYANKEIVIIGSGATTVTLLPALAEKASRVTMLQRSPSYVLSQPREDGIEKLIRWICPQSLVHQAIRIKWLVVPYLFMAFCRWLPALAIRMLHSVTSKQLPAEISADPHFKPSYNPFQQRMCFCPDGDFYASLRSGKAMIVTGVIDKVSSDSIRLTDGKELHPDIIVTATGLKIQLAGGIALTIDDKPFKFTEKFLWKNVMLQDLPNAVFVIGYVDASWTLGADATAQLICRMLKQMKIAGATVAVPRVSEDEEGRMKVMPVLKLSSTYIQKAKDVLPKAGDGAQWRARSTYFNDIYQAWYGDLKTGMEYIRAAT